MTLTKRILHEKRATILPLVLVLVVNVLAYAFVVYPLVRREAGATDRADGAASTLKVAERDLAAARAGSRADAGAMSWRPSTTRCCRRTSRRPGG